MRIFLYIAFLLIPTVAFAQLETIEKPYSASKLAVRLVAPNDEPIVGATVQIMSSGWKKVLAEGATNLNGYFASQSRAGKTYFLRLTARAFRQYHIKIRVRKSKVRMIKMTMELAI